MGEMIRIYLTPEESACYQDDEGLIVITVEPQPFLLNERGNRLWWPPYPEACEEDSTHENEGELFVYLKNHALFTEGDILVPCGEWHEIAPGVSGPKWIYLKSEFDENSRPNWNWKPASTMPLDAAPYTLVVTKVECKRVRDISNDEAKATGTHPPAPHRCGKSGYGDCYVCAFKYHWNRTYQPIHPFDTAWAWYVRWKKEGK